MAYLANLVATKSSTDLSYPKCYDSTDSFCITRALKPYYAFILALALTLALASSGALRSYFKES